MRGTLSDQFRGKHPFFWVVIVAAVISVCSWAFAGTISYKYLGMHRNGHEVDNQMRVSRIYPGGPAEGKLQVGDVIQAINVVTVTRDGLRQSAKQRERAERHDERRQPQPCYKRGVESTCQRANSNGANRRQPLQTIALAAPHS